MAGNPNPPKRGTITGWSAAAARRNTAFLRSVDERELHGHGYAITLTVRDCPPTPEAWAKGVKAWIERQARAGMIRLHWVMEFQRRGVPHLHAAAWFAEELQGLPGKPLTDWVEVAAAFGASLSGQHIRPIDGPVGWFEYMAKHCSRSRQHYQRQRDAVPQAWESSGKVWGKRGQWVTIEPVHADLSDRQFWQLRRLVKRWRIAEARQFLPLNRRQVGYLRRLLKCADRKTSETRPVSEWVPEAMQLRLIAAAVGRDST